MRTLFYAFSLFVIVSCQKHETREQKYLTGQLQEQYQVIESDGNFLKDGTYKSWFSNGQIEKEGEYIKNKKNGIWKSWYSKGVKSLEENYIEDSLNGNSTLWYSNGTKWMEQKYVKNKLEGQSITWYENGKKSIEGNYTNNKRNGEWLSYNKNGELERRFSYKNGINISIVGSKWIDKEQNMWDFSEDGTVVKVQNKTKITEKGTYVLNIDDLVLDGSSYKIIYFTPDSFFVQRKIQILFGGVTTTDLYFKKQK